MTILLHSAAFEELSQLYRKMLLLASECIDEQLDKRTFRDGFQPTLSRVENLLLECVYRSPLTPEIQEAKQALESALSAVELGASVSSWGSRATRFREAASLFSAFLEATANYQKKCEIDDDDVVARCVRTWISETESHSSYAKPSSAILYHARKGFSLATLFRYASSLDEVKMATENGETRLEVRAPTPVLTVYADKTFGMFFDIEVNSDIPEVNPPEEKGFEELLGTQRAVSRRVFLGKQLEAQLKSKVEETRKALVTQLTDEYLPVLEADKKRRTAKGYLEAATALDSLIAKASSPEEQEALKELRELAQSKAGARRVRKPKQ